MSDLKNHLIFCIFIFNSLNVSPWSHGRFISSLLLLHTQVFLPSPTAAAIPRLLQWSRFLLLLSLFKLEAHCCGEVSSS